MTIDNATLSKTALSFQYHCAKCKYTECRIILMPCHYAECGYTECHFDERHYAECFFDVMLIVIMLVECQYAEHISTKHSVFFVIILSVAFFIIIQRSIC